MNEQQQFIEGFLREIEPFASFAAAKRESCVELCTTEGTGKPLFRVTGLRLVSLK